VSKEQIVDAVRYCMDKLGHVPSRNELRKMAMVSPKQIRWHFGTYTQMLRACGLERHGGGVKLDMEALLRDWAGLVRDLKKLPSLTDYEQFSKYSTSPLLYRFGTWAKVPLGMKQYIEESGKAVEMQDVLEVIEAQMGDVRPGRTLRPRRIRNSESGGPQRSEFKQGLGGGTSQGPDDGLAEGPSDEFAAGQDNELAAGHDDGIVKSDHELAGADLPERTTLKRGAYGSLMRYGPMVCAPTNEQGVLFLFGAMAEKLGFAMLKVGTAFPDCQVFRVVDGDRLELIDVEIEFESRNFLKHMHDVTKCRLIVCWRHNWPECPLPVIELRQYCGKPLKHKGMEEAEEIGDRETRSLPRIETDRTESEN
jgi:Homing endonuclease associated repeat